MGFPGGFLWGGSTSAEQAEGGWDEGGKSPVMLDYAAPADGVERVHDPYRTDYLRQHIAAMRAAVEEDGVNLMGYTTWGPLDLVATGTGQMSKLYGFVYVDMDDKGAGDCHRVRKDSFWWYQRVIATNGEDLDP